MEAFVHSDRSEATLTLTPPKAGPISLRVVRLVAPDGNVSVLLTNLNDSIRFPATAVIARILMVLSTDPDDPAAAASQFKHAMITLAEEAFVLTPRCPQQALAIFRELLSEIARVSYYPPRTPRPSQPRVSKKPISKWQVDKGKRIAMA